MIVDTSALVAILLQEPHAQVLDMALLGEPGLLPAPALVEFMHLAHGRLRPWLTDAENMLSQIYADTIALEQFIGDDAQYAAQIIPRYGKGNGGPLNLVDLMVYAVHKRTGLPILCTGRDFADTDAVLHPASRRD